MDKQYQINGRCIISNGKKCRNHIEKITRFQFQRISSEKNNLTGLNIHIAQMKTLNLYYVDSIYYLPALSGRSGNIY